MLRNILRNFSKKPKETPFYPLNSQNDINLIRNLGIIAHVDAGKTTLTERMLYYCGALAKPGSVDDGNTVTDYLQQERQRGITIRSAAITFNWENFQMNLIDTPGHIDFSGEVERAMRVMDGCIVVLDGATGVQTQTENVWKQATKHDVKKIIFLNKMDAPSANVIEPIQDIVKKLKTKPLLLQLPISNNEKYHGHIDLIEMNAIIYSDELGNTVNIVPIEQYNEKLNIEALKERENMLETLSEVDDEFAEKFLSGEFTVQDIQSAVRYNTINDTLTPVLLGSALKNRGVQSVLNGIISYLPSPAEIKPIYINNGGLNEEISHNNSGFCGLAYKVLGTKERGTLVYIRVYSGKLKNNTSVYNSTLGQSEKITRLLRVRADEYYDADQIKAGDIIAAMGLKKTRSGDTLTPTQKHRYMLPQIEMPPPVFFCSLETASEAQMTELLGILQYIVREDPSIGFSLDEQSKKYIVTGLGELQLEILRDRIEIEYGLKTILGPMQVSYREGVSTDVTLDFKYEDLELMHYI